MVMGYQFYPWTYAGLAGELREKLRLPVDTPRRIEEGTMQRCEKWVMHPKEEEPTTARVDRLLARFVESRGKGVRELE